MKEFVIKVAILSMYSNPEAAGLNNIRQLLEEQSGKYKGVHWEYTVFETRFRNQLPNPGEFDVFISTGGPGDPHDGAGADWENRYFQFLDKIFRQDFPDARPKFMFSICHSFQLLCRHFGIASVTEREEKPRFGVFSCAKNPEASDDPLFGKLQDNYLVVENRKWQCIPERNSRINQLGMKVLASENTQPNSALMALRITPNWVATQFHPEAGISSMRQQYGNQQEEINRKHGNGKWEELMQMLSNQNPSLDSTREILLPGFLQAAADRLLHYSMK